MDGLKEEPFEATFLPSPPCSGSPLIPPGETRTEIDIQDATPKLSSMLDAGLRNAISLHPGRAAKHVRISSDEMSLRLAQIAPSIFRPSFATDIASHSPFITRIVSALATVTAHLNHHLETDSSTRRSRCNRESALSMSTPAEMDGTADLEKLIWQNMYAGVQHQRRAQPLRSAGRDNQPQTSDAFQALEASEEVGEQSDHILDDTDEDEVTSSICSHEALLERMWSDDESILDGYGL